MRLLTLMLGCWMAWAAYVSQSFPMGALPVSHSASCSAPSAVAHWGAYYAGNLCGSSHTACGAGNTSVYQATDTIGTNNLQQATAADQPVWTTSCINSQSCFAYNSGGAQFLGVTSLAGSANYSVAATFKVSTLPPSSQVNMIFCATSGYHGGPCLIAYNSNGSLFICANPWISTLVAGVCDASAIAAGTWVTYIATYNYTGGSPYAITLLRSHAGTTSIAASGTTTDAMTRSGPPVIGYAEGIGSSIGDVADASLFTSIVTAASDGGVAAWSQCQYGI